MTGISVCTPLLTPASSKTTSLTAHIPFGSHMCPFVACSGHWTNDVSGRGVSPTYPTAGNRAKEADDAIGEEGGMN